MLARACEAFVLLTSGVIGNVVTKVIAPPVVHNAHHLKHLPGMWLREVSVNNISSS